MKTKSNKIGIQNIFYIIKLSSSKNHSRTIPSTISHKIHRSNKALSVRIENIERRREERSSNSSHGKDEGGWRNERYRERRNHKRYGGRQRE